MVSPVDASPAPEASGVAPTKRAPPTNLTVNTALPPAPVKSSRPPSAQRANSSSSLTTSPSSSACYSPSSTTASTRKTTSPSVSGSALGSKRASPRCSSTACAAVSDRSVRLLSPSPSSSASASRAAPAAPALAPALSAPISTELYFRLLKKSHVLDQLLHVHAHLATQQQQLRRLEADRARADSVQAFVFQELDAYKRQFVEAQQFLLELLEAMTALTVQERELQRGAATSDAKETAQRAKEDEVVRELEAQVSAMQRQGEPADGARRCLESSALRAVGLRRVEELAGVCAGYEAQLRKGEAELSRAMHSAYKDECLAKLQRYEAMQQQHEGELKVLTTRIDNLTTQTSELQGVIDDQRDELALLKEASAAQQQRHAAQTAAIETFGTELKAELRKRYGVVPSVVDTRWHAFFPHCAAPE